MLRALAHLTRLSVQTGWPRRSGQRPEHRTTRSGVTAQYSATENKIAGNFNKSKR